MEQSTIEMISQNLKDVIAFAGERIIVHDSNALRAKAIDELVNNAVFGDEQLRQMASFLIWEAGLEVGIRSSSIHELYMAAGRGEYSSKTVPAINLRGLTYDAARSVFRSAIKNNVGSFIFEIARSEIGYTNQRPSEYATVVIAAAIKEGFRGPVFIQGDHFQASAKKYSSNPEEELLQLKNLIREAIEAGFYNIDIDTSTLVDINKPTVIEQQRMNYELSAELSAYIRELEPKGVTVSIGGEIGEVGGKNSTVEELQAYLNGYKTAVESSGRSFPGLSKISVQTGTTHGGVVLPDGSIAKVKIDFDTLGKLSAVARQEYGLAGAVQHGASTLPDDAFHRFPETGTAEIHLATGFQNMIYEHPSLSDAFKDTIYSYLSANFSNERKEGESETQFIYKTRKKGFGPFKKQWWELPEETRNAISAELEEKFTFLFKKLNVTDTKELVEKNVSATPIHKKKPFQHCKQKQI